MSFPTSPPRPRTAAEVRVELRHARQLLHLAVSALMMAKGCSAQELFGPSVHAKIDTATATAADAMQMLDLQLGD